MEVKTFASLIVVWRNAFRHILENGLKEVYFEDERISFKEWIVKECFGHCCSAFEEQTVVENLKEEFGLYLDQLKGE